MTREAALLGIPTVSIYAGEPAAVDLYLERAGLLRRLTDNAPLELTPRSTQPVRLGDLRRRGQRIIERFVRAGLEYEAKH